MMVDYRQYHEQQLQQLQTVDEESETELLDNTSTHDDEDDDVGSNSSTLMSWRNALQHAPAQHGTG